MNYKNIKSIIFICKYNIFRSEVAEAIFNKINKNNKIKVISRGFIMGGSGDKAQKAAVNRLGIKIKFKPNPIRLDDLIKTDLIVVVANDIPKIMFNYWLAPIDKKLIIWRISDEQKMNDKNIEKIIKKIKRKVERLVKKLEKEK